jgi:hypothetical protein
MDGVASASDEEVLKQTDNIKIILKERNSY